MLEGLLYLVFLLLLLLLVLFLILLFIFLFLFLLCVSRLLTRQAKIADHQGLVAGAPTWVWSSCLSLLPNDLDQHPLGSSPIKLAVEDLFPWPEVELALGDGHDDLPAHDLPLHVGVGVILARPVVPVPLR